MSRMLASGLCLLSALAFFWPQLQAGLVGITGADWPTDFDPFLATQQAKLLSPMFAVAMFVIGCLLPRDEVRQVFLQWPSVLGGTAAQYLIMPTLGYACGRLFQLEGAEMIGVVLVGCVPGAMASNVITLAAQGNVSYSVSLTTCSTCLSPLIVPFVLWLFLGEKLPVDPKSVAMNLAMTVVIPVVLGHLLCQQYPRLESRARRYGPWLANVVILWIIAVVVGVNRSRMGEVSGIVLATLLTINLLGYLAGYYAGIPLRLDEQRRRALTVEVGMQNAGLGSVMALEVLKNAEAAIPPAVYTFGCMLTGTLLATYWSWGTPLTSAKSEVPDSDTAA